MKRGIYILYENGEHDVFEEKDIDCTKLTIKGHASSMIDAWEKSSKGVYRIDSYNAVSLEKIISISVIN